MTRADGVLSGVYTQQTFLRSGKDLHTASLGFIRGVHPWDRAATHFVQGLHYAGFSRRGGSPIEARDPDLAASRRYKPLSGSQTHPSRVVYVRELRSPGSVCCTVALGKVDSAWYGTHPSIVSPSLTGVFIGGGGFRHIANRVQDRGARC